MILRIYGWMLRILMWLIGILDVKSGIQIAPSNVFVWWELDEYPVFNTGINACIADVFVAYWAYGDDQQWESAARSQEFGL
jgi:hypothetical protein